MICFTWNNPDYVFNKRQEMVAPHRINVDNEMNTICDCDLQRLAINH
jgi:hypothetical protein